MKKLLFLFLLVASPVWACNSYEDCMEFARCQTVTTYGEHGIVDESARCILSAIAYKLEEISKDQKRLIQHQETVIFNLTATQIKTIDKLDEISKKLDKPKTGFEAMEEADKANAKWDAAHKK